MFRESHLFRVEGSACGFPWAGAEGVGRAQGAGRRHLPRYGQLLELWLQVRRLWRDEGGGLHICVGEVTSSQGRGGILVPGTEQVGFESDETGLRSSAFPHPRRAGLCLGG